VPITETCDQVIEELAGFSSRRLNCIGGKKGGPTGVFKECAFLSVALEEAIYAYADFYERHGVQPSSFRFEVVPCGKDLCRRGYEREREFASLDGALTNAAGAAIVPETP